MISPQRLVFTETRNSLFINLLISAVVAFSTIPKLEYVSLVGGPESAGFGLLMASLLFPTLAGLLITNIIKTKIANGKLKITPLVTPSKLLLCFPSNTFIRSLVLALFFCLVASSVIFILNVFFGNQWSYANSILLNIMYVELMTLVVVPIIVFTSLR